MTQRNRYTGFGPRSPFATPQSQPIPGREPEMVPNNAGGFGFAVDDMTRFKRFLLLGSEQGTYYVGAYDLTKQNLQALERLLVAGRGREVVDTIVAVSESGRAPNNDPALFALARACACDTHGSGISQHVPAVRAHTFHGGAEHHPELAKYWELAEGGILTSKDGSVTFERHGDMLIKTRRGDEHTAHRLHEDDVEVRRYALAHLHRVARTGTHFLHFQAFVEQFRGRGRALQRASQDWYNKKGAGRLAYQLVKYQSRDGWSTRDVLRLCRPTPPDEAHNALYGWATKGWDAVPSAPPEDAALAQVWAFERGKVSESAEEVASLIMAHDLPREAVGRTEHLRHIKVWEALLPRMGLEAMTRNLAVMTRNEVLVPGSDFTRFVCTRLTSPTELRLARLHPLKLLAAYLAYAAGGSEQHRIAKRRTSASEKEGGSTPPEGETAISTWTPIPEVVAALNEAFYLAFDTVEPTGKPILLGIDVSGSMVGSAVGMLKKTPKSTAASFVPTISGLSAHMGAAVLAMVIARSEWSMSESGLRLPNWHVMAFDTSAYQPQLTPLMKLDEVVAEITRHGGGGTDCAVPFLYAMGTGLDVEAIVTLSDSESWAGRTHASQALAEYRRRIGHPVRAVNVQMVPNHVSTNDPADADAMEVIGFDTNAPGVINTFLRGEF